MKVLVIGSGAREHAIIWKLRQNPEIKEIFCSPGNGGTAFLAKNIPACAEGDWNSYADFAEQNKIGLTLVGPENPLAEGIVDIFRTRSLKIFGPDKKSAQLEASKIFAKQFMKKYGIPTAEFQTFDNAADALKFISNLPLTFSGDHRGSPLHFPIVVKADGLAAGKGVSVCETPIEAKEAIEKMMVQKVFGKAGEKIVIEERLSGEELSLMAFCDGKTLKSLPLARDYKRVFDGDQGPNTGGMGAFSPAPITAHQWNQIKERVLDPFLEGLQGEKLDYRGLIYFGLMLTDRGPYVLEFNVRFGDPETQVVLPLLQTDLISLCLAVTEQNLDKIPLEISEDACVGVVCASGGYPGVYGSAKEIWGLETIASDVTPPPAYSPTGESFDSQAGGGVIIFHAGTVREDGKTLTSGGRVVTVVGKDVSLKEARRKAYGAVFKIEFHKMHYRNDIGKIQ